MNNRLINTGATLAISAWVLGITNWASATDCEGLRDESFDIVPVVSGAVTLTNNRIYLNLEDCDFKADIVIPSSAKVTIMDSAGMKMFESYRIKLNPSSSLTYNANADTASGAFVGPTSGTATVTITGKQYEITAEGTNVDKLNIVTKATDGNAFTLIGFEDALTSTLQVGVGIEVTLEDITSIPVKLSATGKIITSDAATTLIGK